LGEKKKEEPFSGVEIITPIEKSSFVFEKETPQDSVRKNNNTKKF